MKKLCALFFLFQLSLGTTLAQAEEIMSATDFNLYTPGDLNGQDNWVLTKHDSAALGVVNVNISDTASTDKFAEITNESSLLITRTSTAKNAGVLEFKMRHNKDGLFYLYAQTSDNGGQLLFSIQFTPTSGILLEEADKQITLLPDYNPDQWYLFNIDFDNTRGAKGTFKVTIDDAVFGEYAYVNSESTLFDLAQITFGSESSGGTSVSAFADTVLPTFPQATSTASADLLQLSISLSSTSISSNLDNGLIVTASLDGIASVATSSINFDPSTTTATVTPEKALPETESFIQVIIDSVIELFTPETEPVPTESITPEIIPLPPVPTETDLILPEPVPIPELPPEEISADESLPENAVQSVLSNDETTNEINTVEF
jgi:hypothetical protein